MCRFREKQGTFYKCLIRGKRCSVVPERQKICEANMARLAPGVEVVIYYDREHGRFSMRLEGTIHGRLL